MTAPHFSPDARVQQLLNDYLDIPAGLREYVHRKVRDIKAYTEQMSQFQRNNFPEPPADPEGFASWERELEADVARARAEREPTRRRSKERAK